MAAPNFSSVDDTLGFYNYDPNAPAAVFGILSFTAVATVHLWQFSRHRPWHFWAMHTGMIVECVGLGARVVSVYNPTHRHAFFTSYIALLLAPSLVVVACYTTFSRIMWWVTPPERRQLQLLWCPLRFVAPASILFSLLASFFTLLGAGIAAATYMKESLSEDLPQRGLAVLKTGLILQLLGLAAFGIIAVRFMLVSHHWISRSQLSGAPPGTAWCRLGWTVVTAIMLLTVIATYRIADLYSSLGDSLGYLALQEWPFWVLNTVPMLGLSILLSIVYPGQILPREFLGFHLKKQKQYDTTEDIPFSYDRAPDTRLEAPICSPPAALKT